MANSKSPNKGLKCNYVEFGDKLSIKFNGALDSSIADFWNEIDPTMVKRKKTSASQIEVSQILRNNPSHHNFPDDS